MHAEPKTVTHDDLARTTGVSVTTIKSYRRKFPGFIPVAGFGKPIRFHARATDICLSIRDCFAKGLSVKETRTRLEQAGHAPDPASVPAPSDAASASRERMDEFLRAAGVMMQSVAGLAEAQRKADERLDRLEALIEQLAGTGQSPASQAPPDTAANPAPAKPAPARRVVRVRSSQGTVDSYDLDPKNSPPSSLLDVPVAIQAEDGDFLGLPGRLPLRRLARHLAEDRAGQTPPSWSEEQDGWRLDLMDNGDSGLGLCFSPRATPSGLELAVLVRLVEDGHEASPPRRMEYFRQLKDRYTQG